MENKCCTCLSELTDKIKCKVFDEVQCGEHEEYLKISRLLSLCTGLELSQYDGFCYNICSDCIADLKYAYSFRKKCWQSINFFTLPPKQTLEIEIQTECLDSDFSNQNTLFCSALKFDADVDDANVDGDDVDVDHVDVDHVDVDVDVYDNDVDEDIDDVDYEEESINVQSTIEESIPTSKTSIVNKKKRNSKKAQEFKKFVFPTVRRQQIDRPESEKQICEICGKHLASGHSLKYHIIQVHTNIRKFPCSICDYRSHRKSDLESHMRMHTGEKPYSCDICHNKYSSASSRTNHRRTHFDESPFSCDICGRTFKKKKLMRQHRAKHDPNCKVQCAYCDKTFMKGSLRKHEMTHTTERPFQCNNCDKGFLIESSLRAHLRTCVSA